MRRLAIGLVFAVLGGFPGFAQSSIAPAGYHAAKLSELLGCFTQVRSDAEIAADNDGFLDYFQICFARNWSVTVVGVGGGRPHGVEGREDGGHFYYDGEVMTLKGPMWSDVWIFGTQASCRPLSDGRDGLVLFNCVSAGTPDAEGPHSLRDGYYQRSKAEKFE